MYLSCPLLILSHVIYRYVSKLLLLCVSSSCIFFTFFFYLKCSCGFISGPDAESGPGGHDASDSARRVGINTTGSEAMTPPSFKMRDENFLASSTPAESLAVHPLQPATDPIAPAAGGPQKTPRKPRKPRTPKAKLIKSPGI